MKLDSLSNTLQAIVGRFQRLEGTSSSGNNPELERRQPARTSIVMDQWHSQTMSGTDICPLSITTLSPAVEPAATRLNFRSATSTQGKYSFFPMKPDT